MLKKIILGALCATALGSAIAADVGVSVHVTDPGLYGRVDIGRVPQPPQLLYPQPMVIQQPRYAQQAPIYLHVPHGHSKKWAKHCHKYNACGQPVYFVQDGWYQQHYQPHQQQQRYAQPVYGHGDHRGYDDDHKHKKEKKHKEKKHKHDD